MWDAVTPQAAIDAGRLRLSAATLVGLAVRRQRGGKMHSSQRLVLAAGSVVDDQAPSWVVPGLEATGGGAFDAAGGGFDAAALPLSLVSLAFSAPFSVPLAEDVGGVGVPALSLPSFSVLAAGASALAAASFSAFSFSAF